MSEAIFWVALVMAAISWLIFFNQLYQITGLPRVSIGEKVGGDIRREGIDPAKVMAETAKLASSFGKVGAGPTAATLSALYLIVALIAAGLGKL